MNKTTTSPSSNTVSATTSEPSKAAFSRARANFPVLNQLTYLSVCDKAIISRQTRAAVDSYLDKMECAGATRAQHEEYVERARIKFAKLINADREEVAFVRNVSDGINSIACAIDWRAGDNVVLTAELEHPNNLYPWRHLERRGVELRVVAPRAGAIDAEATIGAIDTRTRVVTAASVTFAPGLRTDLATIGRTTRERGILFVVDAVQSAGVLAHDVELDLFDCLATSTSKGLLGIYGSGFLYCRRAVADILEPIYLSRSGVDLDASLHSEGGSEAYRYAPGARRFEVGSYSLAGAYAVDSSLDLILDLGKEAIERHVLGLSKAFTFALEERDLPVSVPSDSRFLSHIVTVGSLGDGGHDFSRDANINEIAAYLKANHVAFTIRRGQLRFAFHLYNNIDDVSRVIELIDTHTSGRIQGTPQRK